MSCICEACGQQIKERPPHPLDQIDRLYLAFGRCCAGCDFWEHNPRLTRPLGYCRRQLLSRGVAFDMNGPGTITKFNHYALTDAKHVCPKFQDTFDWTQLGVENPTWLRSPNGQEGKE